LVTVTTTDYTVNYRYDYLNRLVSRTVDQIEKTVGPINPQTPQPIQTVQHFIHDGNQIVLEFENNELAQRNFWGAGIDELLAIDNLIDDETLWILADHLNSTRNILRNDNGNVESIAQITYDAFGNIIDGTNPINLGYTGKYFDPLTDLQWNINRWYDSSTGQWISEDPIGFKGDDTNLYRYVENDVIDNADSDGLKREWHHLLPDQFRAIFVAAGIDIDSAEYGWILDEVYHRQGQKNPVLADKTLHPLWNKDWKEFFDSKIFAEIKNKGDKQKMKEAILSHLNKMQDCYKDILKNGIKAEIGYKDWNSGVKQIGDTIAKVKKSRTAAKITVTILKKGAPVIVVLTFAYNASTDGVVIAAENIVKDSIAPVPWMINKAIEESGLNVTFNAPLDIAKNRNKIQNKTCELTADELINTNTEVMRPGGPIPLPDWIKRILNQ
jgi:RHS repeat-associated protein